MCDASAQINVISGPGALRRGARWLPQPCLRGRAIAGRGFLGEIWTMFLNLFSMTSKANSTPSTSRIPSGRLAFQIKRKKSPALSVRLADFNGYSGDGFLVAATLF